MLNNFLENFYLSISAYPFIGLLFVFAFLSFFWIPISKVFKLKKYSGIQRVHEDEISRLGGLVIYLFFWIIYLLDFFKDDLFLNLLISAVPFVFVSLMEDLFHNTTPAERLISMIISCFIFFYINPIDYPIIDIPFIGSLIQFFPVNVIFFTFSILVVMNGSNLIDGMNGLFCFTSIFQLLALLFLISSQNDQEYLNLVIIFLIPLILFLFFNFPLSKLFIGDLGAYLYGFIISIITIHYFGTNQNIYSWLAILILFYPCKELLFSFFRKRRLKKNPFEPDNLHLHTKIYYLLTNKLKIPKCYANPLTTISLTFFWFIPFLISINYSNNLKSIWLAIIGLYLVYNFIYQLVIKKLND